MLHFVQLRITVNGEHGSLEPPFKLVLFNGFLHPSCDGRQWLTGHATHRSENEICFVLTRCKSQDEASLFS
jgi:hypothetical protein